jgi:hypothetical protein
MLSLRTIILLVFTAASIVPASYVNAQVPDDLTAISQQLVGLYPTAKVTADGTDLEAAGAVLVLQKDNLIMNKVQLSPVMPNVYKNRSIAPEGFIGVLGRFNAHAPPGIFEANNRAFMTGEKFWVIAIQVNTDGAYFFLMSDPIQNQRYHARLKFTFPKGTASTADGVVSLVSEVLKVDAGGSENALQEQSVGNPAAQQPGAVPTGTKTIAIGQTRDQVIALFGVPTKIVQLGAKEVDYFADMKVTFVKNKVTDVK